MLSIPNPYVIAGKFVVVLGLFFGAGAVGYHVRALKADKDIAALELKDSNALAAAETIARTKEQSYQSSIHTLDLKYERSKQLAPAKKAELVHSLSVGAVQLRDEWQPICPINLPHDPQTPRVVDDQAAARNEDAAAIVQDGADADEQIRALQQYVQVIQDGQDGK